MEKREESKGGRMKTELKVNETELIRDQSF
jgi:hypothetical protein